MTEETQKFIHIVEAVNEVLYDPKLELEYTDKWNSITHEYECSMTEIGWMTWKLTELMKQEMNLPEPYVFEERSGGFIQFKGMPRVNIRRCRPKGQRIPYLPEWIYSIYEEDKE